MFMQPEKFVISFDYQGFINEAVVTAFPAEKKDAFNYIVEICTREYIVWKTDHGWKDLNGASNEFLISMGVAIEEYQLQYQA